MTSTSTDDATSFDAEQPLRAFRARWAHDVDVLLEGVMEEPRDAAHAASPTISASCAAARGILLPVRQPTMSVPRNEDDAATIEVCTVFAEAPGHDDATVEVVPVDELARTRTAAKAPGPIHVGLPTSQPTREATLARPVAIQGAAVVLPARNFCSVGLFAFPSPPPLIARRGGPLFGGAAAPVLALGASAALATARRAVVGALTATPTNAPLTTPSARPSRAPGAVAPVAPVTAPPLTPLTPVVVSPSSSPPASPTTSVEATPFQRDPPASAAVDSKALEAPRSPRQLAPRASSPSMVGLVLLSLSLGIIIALAIGAVRERGATGSAPVLPIAPASSRPAVVVSDERQPASAPELPSLASAAPSPSPSPPSSAQAPALPSSKRHARGLPKLPRRIEGGSPASGPRS